VDLLKRVVEQLAGTREEETEPLLRLAKQCYNALNNFSCDGPESKSAVLRQPVLVLTEELLAQSPAARCLDLCTTVSYFLLAITDGCDYEIAHYFQATDLLTYLVEWLHSDSEPL